MQKPRTTKTCFTKSCWLRSAPMDCHSLPAAGAEPQCNVTTASSDSSRWASKKELDNYDNSSGKYSMQVAHKTHKTI